MPPLRPSRYGKRRSAPHGGLNRLEEARTDEAPPHAAQADEDAARADGVHLRHEAVVGAEREAEQEQKDADGPREHLIGDLDDEGLPAEEETHREPRG